MSDFASTPPPFSGEPASASAAAVHRPHLDVEHLPGTPLDHRSPIWWGNLLLLFIETTMIALLIAAYFYLRNNFNLWPPPQSNTSHGNFNPVPDLLLPSISVTVMVLSLVPMFISDRAALHRKEKLATIALAILLLFDIACMALRFQEFPALNFRWNDNAYASVTWTLLGVHLVHMFVAAGETVLMLAWILAKGMDDKHARDIRVTAVYWYWIVALWVVLYFIVFVGPRIS